MTYASECIARADCVGFWGLDDAGGATEAADSGPSNIPLPKISTPTFGAAGFVSGLATSLSFTGGQAVGVLASSNAIFHRPTALTLCGWIHVVSTSAVGGWQQVYGRDTAWHCDIANSLQVSAQHDITGMGTVYEGVRAQATYGQVYAAGDILFLAASWSKETGLFQCMINAELEAQVVRDIDFPTGIADNFRVGGWDTNQTGVVRASGVALFSSQLGAGELRALMAQNTSFTPPSQGSVDPPNPSATVSAGLFGAKVTTNGARITTTSGKVYRPEDYAAMGLAQGGKTVPVTSGWDAKLPFRAALTGYEWLVTNTRRPVLRPPGGSTWWDGGSNADSWHSYQGGPAPANVNATIFFRTGGAAILNHWIHGGVGGSDSVLTKLTSSMLDVIDVNTDPQGLSFPPQWGGLPFQLWSDAVMAVLCMKPYVTPAKHSQWVNLLVRAGNWCWTTGAAATFMVNGNQNLGVCALFYGLFLLTGQQMWLDRYNATWDFTLYPVAGAGTSSFGVPRTVGYGLFSYDGVAAYKWARSATPTQARVTNDTALLAMNATTGKGFISETNETADIGMDHDYLQLQLNQAWKLYQLTKGARELRLFNIMFNQHLTRVIPADPAGSETWTADFTGGTRRNSMSDPYFDGIMEYVRASGLRPDWTTDIFSHWEGGVWPAMRDWWHGNGLGDRYLGTTVGMILLGSPQWAGIPT